MLVFREWLALDRVRSEVLLPAMREARLMRAAERTIEFALRAISPAFGMLVEEADSPSEVDAAEAIRSAAQKVRWAAMIERAEMVERVKEIFVDRYLPMFKERAEEVRKMVEDERRGYDDPDSTKSRKSAMTHVARRLGMSVDEVEDLASRAPQTRSESRLWEAEEEEEEEEEEDEWEMPDDMKALIGETFDDKLSKIIKEVKPILVRLGYVDDSELNDGSSHEKLMVLDPAIRRASEETGNAVPLNAETDLLKKSAAERAKARENFMTKIVERFKDYAEYQGHSQGVSRFFDPVRQAPREGETVAPEQFLSDAVISLVNSLTTRVVSKKEGVREWEASPVSAGPSSKEDLGLWASKFLNKIKSRIRWETSKREGRAKSLSYADPEDDSGRLVSIHAGRKDDDGARGNIDPTDYRTTTSDREAAQTETRRKILDAFVYAMRRLKQEDSLHAVIACVRFGLECDADGDMPAKDDDARTSAEKILSLVPADSSTGEQEKADTIEGFLAKLGVGGDVGASDVANQKMVQRIQELGAWDLLGTGRKPSPRNADGTRMTRRPIGDPEGVKKWDAFLHTVRDAMGEALKKIGLYMNFHLSGSGEAIISGRTEPSESDAEGWDINRFLRRAFPRAKIENNGSKIRLTFFKETGEAKHVWSIEVKRYTDPKTRRASKFISLQQDGFPAIDPPMAIPQPVKCQRCEGEDERCPDCMGWGYTLDMPKVVELERKLIDLLPRQMRRSRGSKASEG